MKLRKCLQELLVPGCLLEEIGENTTLRCKDKKVQYSITLTGIGKKVLIINLGKGPHSSLISESGGYKKICDYAILVPQQKEIVVLFCELKRSYDPKGKVQLRSSIPVVDYLQSMLRINFEENRSFKHYFAMLVWKYSERFDKQRTRPIPIREVRYKNIKIRVITGKSIPFGKVMPQGFGQ